MENRQFDLYGDVRFKQLLDECYFHPSRNYESDEIKFIARNAMMLLWNMEGIVVNGIYFSEADIRRRMVDEMMRSLRSTVTMRTTTCEEHAVPSPSTQRSTIQESATKNNMFCLITFLKTAGYMKSFVVLCCTTKESTKGECLWRKRFYSVNWTLQLTICTSSITQGHLQKCRITEYSRKDIQMQI